MNTELMLVTPNLARQFLAMNTDNRKLKINSVVPYLIGVLQRGEWKVTHQGIAISKDNVLLDGQHRLSAISESGIPAQMLVSTGLDNDCFLAIDGVNPRSLGDRTRIENKHAQIITFLYAMTHTNHKISSEQALEIYDDIKGSIVDLQNYCNSSAKYFSSAPFKCAAVIHSLNGNRDYAFEIYRKLVTSDFTGLPLLPEILVRKFIKGEVGKSSVGGGSVQMQTFLYAMTIFEKDSKRKQISITDEFREKTLSLVKTTVFHKEFGF